MQELSKNDNGYDTEAQKNNAFLSYAKPPFENCAGFFVAPASSSDISQLSLLEEECFSGAWSEKTLASQLEGESYLTLVAKGIDDTVFGYISGSFFAPEAEIFRVATALSHRKKKIGSALVSEFISRLSTLGCTKLFLEVRASNAPALALYSSFGFSECGRRKNYYKNPTEDAILLFKEIERM